MTKFLEPNNEFAYNNEFQNTGDLHLNARNLYVGDAWRIERFAVTVANVAERSEYLQEFTDLFGEPSADNACTVFRVDGTSTGLVERTVDGVNWFPMSHTAGDIEMTMANVAPNGWLLAQGQTVANAATTYPALWNVADSSWKAGSSLKLPDLRGRVPVGATTVTNLDPNISTRNMGAKGGFEKVILAEGETPIRYHRHDVDLFTSSAGNHRHRHSELKGINIDGKGIEYMYANPKGGSYTTYSGDHVHRVFGPTSTPEHVSFGGTTDAHENMQPFIVVNFKIKV